MGLSNWKQVIEDSMKYLLLQQYEQEVAEIAEHIEKLKMPNCSENIALVKMPLVREVNAALNGIELVTSVPNQMLSFMKDVKLMFRFL